jgi:hypothetical protein
MQAMVNRRLDMCVRMTDTLNAESKSRFSLRTVSFPKGQL